MPTRYGVPMKKRICVALTGASGAPYFLRLVARLRARDDVERHLILSEGGKRVLYEECDLKLSDVDLSGFEVHPNKDIGAAPASGSHRMDALAVVPCSMGSLAAIAAGFAENLVHRSAAVQLKEDRKLILAVRESPLSLMNLRAMVTLREAGAVIMPCSPGFYHKPETIDDLLDTIVDRILDHMGLEDPGIKRWKG